MIDNLKFIIKQNTKIIEMNSKKSIKLKKVHYFRTEDLKQK